jgi:phage-related protein
MPQTEIHLYRAANGDVPLETWLGELEQTEPSVYAKCLQRILMLSSWGYEMRRPHADALRDGIYELRIKERRVHYRILYFFFGANVVCLSHGIVKEGAVPPAEIDRALSRKKQVERSPDKHTNEWEVLP